MSSTIIDCAPQDVGGLNSVPTQTFPVAASATLIYPGEPVKLSTVPYVVKLATSEPVIGTTTEIVGVAKSLSTNTSSVDGTVDVFTPLPNTVFKCQALSATAATTAAKITALINSYVRFDLTTGKFTVNTAATSNTYGLKIVGGNPNTNEVYFQIRGGALEGLNS